MKSKIIMIFLLIGIAEIIFAVDIKLTKRLILSQEKKFIASVYTFCVTEDGYYILADLRLADIKIYSPDGKLVKTLGRRGVGPNEFLSPLVCNYNYSEKLLYIVDFVRNRIFRLKRIGAADFQMKDEIICVNQGLRISFLDKQRLLIPEFKSDKDGKSYSLYILNYATNETTFLMPSEIKYGFNSPQEYRAKVFGSPDISAIGQAAFSDFYGNFAYYVWEGDLRVFKINLTSRAISFFGEKSSNYKKPVATYTLKTAKQDMKLKTYNDEKSKMSYLNDVFANKNYIIVIYNKPKNNPESPKIEYLIQFYTPDGKFIKEISVVESCSNMRFFLKKDTNELFALFSTPKFSKKNTEEDIDEDYIMLKYKIIE